MSVKIYSRRYIWCCSGLSPRPLRRACYRAKKRDAFTGDLLLAHAIFVFRHFHGAAKKRSIEHMLLAEVIQQLLQSTLHTKLIYVAPSRLISRKAHTVITARIYSGTYRCRIVWTTRGIECKLYIEEGYWIHKLIYVFKGFSVPIMVGFKQVIRKRLSDGIRYRRMAAREYSRYIVICRRRGSKNNHI